jgi:uncharacterized protein YndB with AHSA1/START domain
LDDQLRARRRLTGHAPCRGGHRSPQHPLEVTMLKTIAIIAAILAVGIAGVLIYAATKPNEFRVQRSLTVKAPPEKIFPLINEFRTWTTWSPYEHRDPNLKRTYSGPSAGKGAIYEWDGDKNVGSGRMEILEATPPSKIVIKLDFIRPFEGHNTAEFTMAPAGDTTTVTWAMYGPSPYIAKLMGTFMNLDRMIGKDFETGLANLKAAAEK